MNDTGIQREPTTFDAVLGATTLLIGLGDVIWLSLLAGVMLGGGEWSNSVQLATTVSFVVAVLLLGLVATSGIILRCMGIAGGPASPASPLIAIGVRIGLISLPFVLLAVAPAVWIEILGLDSAAFVSQYLSIPTPLLLLIAVVNLRPRGEET